MSLHLYVGLADITRAEHIQKRRFTIARDTSESKRAKEGYAFFFQRRNAEGILFLDYNQDDPRGGEGITDKRRHRQQ